MEALQLLILLAALSKVQCKPTTESTQALLMRLGFDPVQRPPLNYHTKRIATETNKARYHNDFYSSDTDSRMFVVKLPPHYPYYSHLTPEKFKNEAMTKAPVSFQTNGKPGRIYHWNIPVIKKMTQARKGVIRQASEDSKIYHLKISSNKFQKFYPRLEQYKNNSKHTKHKQEEKLDATKSNNHYRNKLYRFTDAVNATQNDSQKFSDSDTQNIFLASSRKNNLQNLNKNKNHHFKKFNKKHANEVSKIKNQNQNPTYYMPAIPKRNSFYKYFTGNGKPNSFYVIEKSKTPTRLHRLL